jgi:hypothetical protein
MAYKPTVRLQSVMGELNTICGLLIVQVMQNSNRHDDICVLKSLVSLKRSHVADYESSFVAVGSPGKCDTIRIDVEPEVLDIWKPLQR